MEPKKHVKILAAVIGFPLLVLGGCWLNGWLIKFCLWLVG